MEQRLSHLDDAGHAHMVDVSHKTATARRASAAAKVRCSSEVVTLLRENNLPKGDALAVARIAGIQAAKQTSVLLPLAHVIGIHAAHIDLTVVADGIEISATVASVERTGVEMEALTAASVTGLALIDMVKGIDRTVMLTNVRVTAKTGGRSGDWKER